MKLNTKIIVFVLEIAIIPLLFLGFIFYHNSVAQINQSTFKELDAIAQIQKNRLQDVLDQKSELLHLFASKTLLRTYLHEYIASPSASLQQTMNDYLRESLTSSGAISKIFEVNSSGIVVASTDPAFLGVDVSHDGYFQQGIQKENVSFLEKNATGIIDEYLVAPLILDGKTLGMVVLITDVDDIENLAKDYTGLGNTGETLLAKHDQNGDALFLTAIRFDPNAGLTRVVLKDKTNIPSVHAIAGEEGVFENAVDYRNVPVFAATRYLSVVDWGIVVKIDQSEALAPVRNLEELFLIILLAVVVLVIFLTIPISRSILTRENRLVAYLAEAKAKNDAILESIGDGVIATDEKGKVIFMNRIAEKALLWNKKEILGKKLQDFLHIYDDKGKFLSLKRRPIQIAIATQKSIVTTTSTTNYFYGRKDGSKFPVAITVTPVILFKKVAGAIEIFRDITNEKEIQKEKDEFISLASHQLKTPITAISWSLESLLEGTQGRVTQKQKEMLEKLNRSNTNMLELVTGFLDVTKIESGGFIVEKGDVDLIGIADLVLEEFTQQVSGKQLKITKIYGKNVPHLDIGTRTARIILQNLISNAIKYTPEKGTVAITIEKTGNGVLISVKDTGYGIPKEAQSSIFKKLYRADNIREKEPTGNGLGLYLVKSLVDKLGGKVWFESEEGKGSTFHVNL